MKTKLSILLFTLMLSTSVSAEFLASDSVIVNVITVKSVDDLKDDTKVTLEGYIVKEIKSEHYLFKDSTGEIEIEIDDKDFRNIKVTPTTKIRIAGEIEKEWLTTTIDVDSVEIAK